MLIKKWDLGTSKSPRKNAPGDPIAEAIVLEIRRDAGNHKACAKLIVQTYEPILDVSIPLVSPNTSCSRETGNPVLSSRFTPDSSDLSSGTDFGIGTCCVLPGGPALRLNNKPKESGF